MMLLTLGLIGMLAMPDDASIRGRVITALGSEPVSGAMVRVTGEGGDRAIITGSDGAFTFQAVPFGEYRVRVMHPGHEPVDLRVVLRAEGSLMLIVPLVIRPFEMEPIRVFPERVTMVPHDDVLGIRLTAPLVPGASPNLSLAPQVASGLAHRIGSEAIRDPAPDPNGGRHAHALHVWGASAERGRVLVDGAPLSAPLHLGGVLPPLDLDRLAAADFRTGAISPRLDGGTSFIMDFETRPGGETGTLLGGELDPLVSRLGFESPVGSTGSFAVSARRINSEAVGFLMGEDFGYGYGDLLARVDHAPGGGGRVNASFFGTREAIVLPRDQGEDEAGWGNYVASLSWWSGEGPDATTAALTYSRGEAGLPLLSVLGGRIASGVDRITASAERHWSHPDVPSSAGLEWEYVRFTREARAPGFEEDPVPPTAPGDRSCGAALSCMSTGSHSLALFGELSWQPTPLIATRAGLRYVLRPGGGGSMDLLPRASLSRVLGDATTLTGAVGRFSQTYAAIHSVEEEGRQESHATTEVAHATHLELSVDHRLAGSELAVTLFLRHHEEEEVAASRTSPGFDISLSRSTARTSTSLGYSFMSAAAVEGPAAPERENRQLAAAALMLHVRSLTLNLSGAWGRGLPFTSIALEHPTQLSQVDRGHTLEGLPGLPRLASSHPAAGPEGGRSYFRMDAALSAQWYFTRGGRRFAVAPYVKLLNAFSEGNALFYLQDDEFGGPPRPLASLPAIPVLGVRWEF
jgi:hypothetical protein